MYLHNTQYGNDEDMDDDDEGGSDDEVTLLIFKLKIFMKYSR
jgi:hypothetical protein